MTRRISKHHPRAAPRDTVTLYVRVPRDLRDRAAEIAKQMGYPHTLTSVASAAFARGIESHVLSGEPKGAKS